MALFLRYSFLLLTLFGLPRLLWSQTLDPTFHIPAIYKEASVADAAQLADGRYVVAGTFTLANGQPVKKLVRLDATGAIDQVFQQNLRNATVQVAKFYPMANGQLLVQGDYQAGATRRRYLFRLNADGTLDPSLTLTFPGPFQLPSVRAALIQPDGRIVIFGYLTSIANFQIIRLLADGSVDPSFNAVLGGEPGNTRLLLQPDGKFLLSGAVADGATGTPLNNIVRLNSDGSLDTSFRVNLWMYATAMALDANGRLLVGGTRDNIVDGQPKIVFRLLPNGSLDPSFTLDTNLPVHDCAQLVVQPSGKIIVLFTGFGQASSSGNGTYPLSNQLQRLLPDGSLDTSFQPGGSSDFLLAAVRSQPTGGLLAWGNIHNFAGQRRTLTLLQPDGKLDMSFAPLLQEPGRIRKILRQADGKLLLAGYFNTIDGHFTDCVGRLLPTGEPDRSFAWRQPNSATWIYNAMATQANGQVLLAGVTRRPDSFGNTDESFLPFFGRLTTTGAPDASFEPAVTLSPSSALNVLFLAAQADGNVLAGGMFTDAAGKHNLTRLTPTGNVDPSFTPAGNYPFVVSGFVQANGAIVCVVPNAAQTASTMDRLLPNGLPDPTFTYSAPQVGKLGVFQLPATGGYIISGNLGADRAMAMLTPTGTVMADFKTPFRPVRGGTIPYAGVNAVIVQPDGRLLVGGYMQQSSQFGSPIVQLARLEATGQLDATFATTAIPAAGTPPGNDEAKYAVDDIVLQPDGAVVAGGYFSEVAGQPVTGLVRLSPPTLLENTSPLRSGSSLQAWPIPTHDILHLSVVLSAHPQRVTLLNMLGKIVVSQDITKENISLNTSALARGLYILQVAYADGLATRQVIIE